MPSLFENEKDREVGEEPAWRRFFWAVPRTDVSHTKISDTKAGVARARSFRCCWRRLFFGVMVGLMLVYSINLPQMDELARYRPNTTTELYDIHGKVFGSFALERRIVVPYTEFPENLKQAIFSIEDKNFETNGGINLVRAASAAYHDVHSKGKTQGASTLTMQLSRNLFLSSEKTYGRKLQEIILTLQIERRFTKQQIFTLYANQIYLGRGTYGFEAGSEYYFSKHAHDLTLPEAAMLAALPKGAGGVFAGEASGPGAEAAEFGVERDARGQEDYGGAGGRRRRLLRWGCISRRRRILRAPYFVEEVRASVGEGVWGRRGAWSGG